MKFNIRQTDCGLSERFLALGSCWLLCGIAVEANPQGLSVASGSASMANQGPVLTVNVSDHALLNWQSFNIAPGEKTVFNQPSAASIVWNQILDSNPSRIFGSIQANGMVVLANQNGFWFGPDSVVKAANFVATTAAGPGNGFFNGGPWSLEIAPPSASIINYGQISAASGGSVFLIAQKIENHGTLTAPDGTLGLYTGKEVLVSQQPDGRGLTAKVVLPAGSVDNFGRLVADAGTIAIHSQVVNQDGLIQADSVREVNGVIEIYASDEVNFGANSITQARGADGQSSPGGKIVIQSEGTVHDAPTAVLSVAGGISGGNGGLLEVSAATFPNLQSQLEGDAANGYTRGHLIIDPNVIRIDASASGTASSGSVSSGSAPATLVLPPKAFNQFSTIDLQATTQIEIRSLWNLPKAPAGGATLTLESGGDILFSQNAGINAGAGWQVSLFAGSKFDGSGGIKAGLGSIAGLTSAVNSYSLATVDGSLTLKAGKDISLLGSSLSSSSGGISLTTISGDISATSALVSSKQGNIELTAYGNISFPIDKQGTVRTIEGGNITATAKTGSITTGGNRNGYEIVDVDYPLSVSPSLGGFSTAAGGNVTLTAAKDITSYLPTSDDVANGNLDGGTGSFGFADNDGNPVRGNVNVTSTGGSVYGHFVIADGTGTITARNGVAGERKNQPLALTTRTGSWTVDAHDIALQEVRNAQGVFNNLGGDPSGNSYYHLFDYSVGTPDVPVTSVTLTSAGTVELVGSNLPRNDSESTTLPVIYPPVLNISAGAGGVILGNQGNKASGGTTIILFPSIQGNLSISSPLGGLQGFGAAGSSIILSDSGANQWTSQASFSGSDHSTDLPIHHGDLTYSEIHLGGSMDDVNLNLGKATRISIGGNVTSSSVFWQHNNSTDNSEFIVGGKISNRSRYTFEQLLPDEPIPDLSLMDQSCVNLGLDLSYDAASRTVILRGKLTPPPAGQLDPLKNFGIKGIDSAGNGICIPATLLTTRVIDALYKDSADITQASQLGYQVSGPGMLTVSARSIDLGITKGIVSMGSRDNPTLAKVSSVGADLSVKSSEDITTFSSAIVSIAGGSVDVSAGGKIVAGSNLVLPSSEGVRGIYSTAGSPVTVTAVGDIDLAGSRIATYNGGKVTVESLAGSIDAGTGGLSFQRVEQVTVDPVTHRSLRSSAFIPGSGILAATFYTGTATVGDIIVTAPKGDVVARSGGIVQSPFNGTSGVNSKVSVSAGSPGHVGNIDASGSGIIGGTIKLDATGDIKGVVFASGAADIKTPQVASLTLIAQGPVTVSAAGLSGTLISFSSISVDSTSINASLQANVVSTGATQNTSASGFASGNAATATATAASADSGKKSDSSKTLAATDDDDLNKKKSKPLLAQTKPRVTVLLPGKLN